MRLLILSATIFLFCSCIFESNENVVAPKPSKFLTVKFTNTGSYPITAIYIKQITDTANWGISLLPVLRLDSMKYVWITGLTSGPTYAFKTMHDSSGYSIPLTFANLYTGAHDTISAYSSKGPNSFEHGYSWGLSFYQGESLAINR
ncbi:MAG: hypothetical protein JNL74_17080 [Fibrobacteres bacterium]|nr:hypothetical protein [Fibrobacterota bacterium]